MTTEQKRMIAIQLCSLANQKEPQKRKFIKLTSINFARTEAVFYGQSSVYSIKY